MKDLGTFSIKFQRKFEEVKRKFRFAFLSDFENYMRYSNKLYEINEYIFQF